MYLFQANRDNSNFPQDGAVMCLYPPVSCDLYVVDAWETYYSLHDKAS